MKIFGATGEFVLPLYTLRFDRVQSDPFAPASSLRIFIDRSVTQYPSRLYKTKERRTALCDYLLRKLHQEVHKQEKIVSGNRFHDLKGGNLYLPEVSQKILEQNGVILCEGDIEVRFTFELPGRGRTIASERAIQVLVHTLPIIVTNALCFTSLDASDIELFLTCYEDQQWLRRHLKEIGLVAFIPDNAILPRASGVSDLPMDRHQAAPFKSPESLRVSVTCPSKRSLTGMGIKHGGKSTLLSAIEHGIYSHIPGDGREYLVCDPSLTKIRAEDGRSIQGTDISPFINNLPFGRDTKNFSTTNASGSTSMAANLERKVECSAMIYDEDTCATNFMIRDKRMQLIVRKEHEPITPLIYKIRALYHEKGVSSILVVGSCGDYVDVSDVVIEMRNYEPNDITEHAKQIATQYPTDLISEGGKLKTVWPL
ncbi:hypothetical protein BX666DRAFT_1859291 [Dichotomocladium elegans]|nr:hypothetical protein BX666DRAFT_1859291 [Dichotomocladium elegans]